MSTPAPTSETEPARTWSALVVDDDPGIRQSLRLCLEAAGGRVLGVSSVQAALEALDRATFDTVFLDLWLGADSGLDALPEILRRQPEIGVVVITAYATFESAVEAMRRGAADYLPKPFSPEQVRLAANRILEHRRLRQRVRDLEVRLAGTDVTSYFTTHNSAFRAFMSRVDRGAASDAVVLLRGESGTGKNVLARWIHDNSPRRERPFVSVNSPALAGELMISALFGHKRGAFTGATTDTAGKVQEAEGGTLFLDEVGDLSADAQARVLRFLNDHSYERLGEARERKADVRVIAATNRDLEQDVAAGRFRADLYYRLDVLPLVVPPLRDRIEDIVPLALHYFEFYASRQAHRTLSFSPAAIDAMRDYAWPGNLRELRNAVERGVILSAGDTLVPSDLGIPPATSPSAPEAGPVALGGLVSLEQLEREHLARVIAQVPTLEGAARILGIDATTLQRKRKRYGLY